mmetsp:Transcript_86635/g.245281  ORF Transcript_86635/g.245281 Transcript_86635/m.245281 type:complete len:270 (-) Transcript_86635:240-1049(-)
MLTVETSGVLLGLLSYTVFFFTYPCLSQILPLGDSYRSLKNDGDRGEWNTRVCSNANALLISLPSLSVYLSSLHLYGLDQHSQRCQNLDDHAKFYGCALGSYFLVDSLVVLWYRKTMGMFYSTLVHHFCGVWGNINAVLIGSPNLYCIWFFVCEISTPMVNLRWFLAKSGYDASNSTLYVVNGLAMVLVFGLVRVFPLPWTLYLHWARDWDTLGKVKYASEFETIYGFSYQKYWFCMLAVFCVLQTNWWILMVKGALKAMRKTPPKKDD